MKNQTITLKIGFAISFLFFLSESSFTQSLSICKGECAENIGVQTMECFKWIPEEGLVDPASSVTDACPNNTTEYTLIITNNEGDVIQSLNYSIQVNDIGVSIVPENPVLCSGSSRRLEATVWGTVTSFTFLWTTGEGTPIIEVEQPGTYSVTVTNIYDNCQDVATVEVTEESTSVSINASSTEVCEGSPITLEAIPLNQNGSYSYSWSNGASNAVISVEQPGVYSVTATDLETGCESSNEIALSSVNISTQILPEEPIACPGKKATLEVADGPYQTIEWSTGESGVTTIMVEEGEYSVTVTNNQGCQATASVTVEKSNDPIAIREYFESKGFYAVDITILGPALRPGGPGDEKIEKIQSSICSETDPCEGNNGCVQNDANLKINIGGTDISNLEEIVAGNLEYFSSEFGYNNAKAYITKNEDICFCEEFDYLAQTENFFENGELVHWIHLWESGTLGSDKLFILTNVPTQVPHYPTKNNRESFLTNMLEVVTESLYPGNFASIGERLIFTLQDCSLDNYLDINPQSNGFNTNDYPVCGNSLFEAPIVMAPSCIPIKLPSIVTLQFNPSEETANFHPNGALTGFTDFSAYTPQATDVDYYKGRTDMGALPVGYPVFKGYYLVTVKDQVYMSPPIEDVSNNPPVITTGIISNINQNQTVTFENWHFNPGYPLPTAETDGYGEFVTDIFSSPCEVLGDKIIENPPPQVINLPEITQIEYENLEFNEEYQGIFINQFQDDGSYIHLFVKQNGEQLEFYIWNCYTGAWEEYEINDINLISEVTAILTQNKNDHTEEGDDESALTDPVCFYLTAEQIGDFNVGGTADPFGTDIKDYAGIDQTTKDKIQNAIDIAASDRWQLQMKFLTTTGSNASPEFPGPPQAAYEYFNNTVLSAADPNSPDLIYWVHYKQDQTAGVCIRFSDDFFTYFNNSKYGEGEISTGEALEVKSVFISSLRDAIVANEESLADGNFSAEGEVESYPPNEKPWFSGIREDNTEDVNFYSVTKEVIGIGRMTLRDFAIPDKVWKIDGNCMFDTPGALMGCGNAVIAENPFVGIAQGISFAQSFVKEPETRQAILDAVRHPGKVVRGIIQEKYDNYVNQGFETMTYNASLDGTTLVMTLLSGQGLLEILDQVKKSKAARETSELISEQVDEFPAGLDHPVWQEFNGWPEAEALEFENFFKKLGNDHIAKFVNNPKMVRVWKDFRNNPDLNLEATFKKFPDPSNTDFYNKFDEIFFANGSPNPLPKTETFLNDVQGSNNLLSTFSNNPITIETWDFANVNSYSINVRKDVGFIESFSVALQRGIMEISEVLNNVTLNKLTPSSVEHILRGNPIGHPNPTGGFHHSSSIINRTDVKLIERTPFGSQGCYTARLEFPNGDKPPKPFFPDEWDEIKTVQEIEHAFLNQLNPQPNGLPSAHKIGLSSEGVPILLVFSHGKINSAWPWN